MDSLAKKPDMGSEDLVVERERREKDWSKGTEALTVGSGGKLGEIKDKE
jgi:hypothetical protein